MADQFGNHNGGGLAFGPDGIPLHRDRRRRSAAATRWATAGSLDTLLAKILRIDVDAGAGGRPPYAIPADNPFVETDGAHARDLADRAAQPVAVPLRPARPATCGSATSGRARGRRSTSRAAGVGGLDFGWNMMEGSHCFRDRRRLRPTG